MKLLIKYILNILPFLLLFSVMWAVSFFRLTLFPMLILSTLGAIGFMALAILADDYSEKMLAKKP